ncbi:MAG: NAD(P)H-dependent oxidoreductase [Marinifilaceae bacterium]|jgi:nitroreductase|nr:NAD(P)H-dependent oxidoreductase [Marinifilaceae bacterium]
MSLLDNLKWRYATKNFDTEKKLSDVDVDFIKKSIQLAPSSYGLQAYKILIIKNPEIKEKLKSASYNQAQISDSSHLFVFCAYDEVDVEYITNFVQMKSHIHQIPMNNLTDYQSNMINSICSKNPQDMLSWTGKQCYIALANLLTACAELKIDACPMEGFKAEEYKSILNLEGQRLSPVVIAAVGYRSENDKTQDLKKLRKPTERLFEEI